MRKLPDHLRVRRWERDELSDEIIPIAKRRVAGILMHQHLMDYNLLTLCVSCYVQGVADTAEALAKEPLSNEPLEFQI